MKTVTCQLNLGKTRVAGYVLYDHRSMAFEETTPRDVKHLIKEKQLNGLKLDENEEIVLDGDGFNQQNIIIKSGVGNYHPMHDNLGVSLNEMFALTKIADTDTGMVYEVVTSRCARLPITEEKLRSLYELNCLTGCWITKEGNIRIADGVDMIDMTSEAAAETLKKYMDSPTAETTEVPEEENRSENENQEPEVMDDGSSENTGEKTECIPDLKTDTESESQKEVPEQPKTKRKQTKK